MDVLVAPELQPKILQEDSTQEMTSSWGILGGFNQIRL